MPTHRVRNVFAGPYVDRTSGLRKDAAWVAAALADPGTRFVPVWRQRSLLQTLPEPAAVLLEPAAVAGFTSAEAILLGRFEGAACFALEFDAAEPPVVAAGAEFADLRLASGLLPPAQAGLLGYARAMVYWRQRHRHCGACGTAMVAEQAGHVMRCPRSGCGMEAFPRIDPAIIVLVTDGERALLGRQASWPPGRYSTIAGFVEPGESLEDAVIREVREETGVEVAEASYQSSQPWPFPSSLMIGFQARAGATAISYPDGELEEARWFTREQLASGTPALPPVSSISFRLIAEWYERASLRRLEDEPGAQLWPLRR